MPEIIETVAAYIEQHQLIPERGVIVVAVSGGADSLCLLHLLCQLCGPDRRYPAVRLHVAHLNHQLRGEASAQDAASVAQLAEAWDLPATIGTIDVPALARREHRSLEDAARTARYRFLREVAQQCTYEPGEALIAVAHHMDDQAETLLLHWLRGGGIISMVGLQPRQQDVIRPLLAVAHADTLAYCRQHQLVPLDDASNSDTRFLRNRIRHDLLPFLESINPGIRATLLRNAEVMRVDVDWIEAQVDACWPTVVRAEQDGCIRLRRSELLSLPLSLQRHLLRRVTARLCEGQSPLELRHYRLIEQLLHRDGTGEELQLHLPHQLHLIRAGEKLTFQHVAVDTTWEAPVLPEPGAEVELPIPGCASVPGTAWIARAEIVSGELLQEVRAALECEDWATVWHRLAPTRYVVYIDSDTLDDSLHVRTRRAGDRLRPLGMQHEKKVQDILVDKRIARAERERIPLFFSAEHCIWLGGVTIDERVRLTSRTRHIVRLSLIPT
jgi:tRNA(Ile)-lysidine synthase